MPQGSVLGPLLFLVFISNLEKKLESRLVEVLKYVDYSKYFTKTEDDIFLAQDILNDLYGWAENRNITFKF